MRNPITLVGIALVLLGIVAFVLVVVGAKKA